MSINKMLIPGFGIGAGFGVPYTVGVAPTSTVTLTGTVLPAGQYYVTGLATGVNVALWSTSTPSAVTGTWQILNGVPGMMVHDGSSANIVNTTTSVTVVFISF